MTKRTVSDTHHSLVSALSVFARLWRGNGIRVMYKFPIVGLFFLVVSISFPYASLSQGASSSLNEAGDYILRVNSSLVILSATVVDRHNALVFGLDKGNFEIYEDHILQPIKHFSHEDIPVTVGLVIDNSGSMGPKRADVIVAALLFARSSNPQDQMFVVNFNEHVSYGLPADIPFTDRRDQLQFALSETKTIGQTALYDAIALALDHLKLGKCDKKVLIVISDGGDNASKHTLAQVVEMAKSSDAIIYTIGIFDEQDGDQKPGVLKRFARETGGEAFFPQSSREIASICEGIAHDIRTQYTLAYVPANWKLESAYRTVEVKVISPGRGRLSARTRTGYSVPPALPPQAQRRVDDVPHN